MKYRRTFLASSPHISFLCYHLNSGFNICGFSVFPFHYEAMTQSVSDLPWLRIWRFHDCGNHLHAISSPMVSLKLIIKLWWRCSEGYLIEVGWFVAAGDDLSVWGRGLREGVIKIVTRDQIYIDKLFFHLFIIIFTCSIPLDSTQRVGW